MVNYPILSPKNFIKGAPTIPPPHPYEDGLIIRDKGDLIPNCSYILKREGKGATYVTDQYIDADPVPLGVGGKYIDEASTPIEMLRYLGKRNNTGFFRLEWQNPDKENLGIPDNCEIGDIVKREFSKIGVTYKWDSDYGSVWSSDFYLVKHGFAL